MCVHLLYANGLNEEGLFRIPGSSIKIKKLKNAINAWFVTLASQNELDNNIQFSSNGDCPASVLAIYNLFKDITAQRPQQQPINSFCGDNSQSTTTSRDDSTLTNSSPCPSISNNQQQLVFDVHTIAGLLKLYLRELPEPLFTHTLYDQWINVTVKTLNQEQTEISLEQLISKLPRTNYDNLRHLIRFLHTLTCHRGQNKMTATNLAITMAPSLIWARPYNIHGNQDNPSDYDYQQQNDHQQQHLDDYQAINMQMSNVGLSASMHALVIENLVKNAERLFPGPVQFTLPGLINYEEISATNSSDVKHERFHKSASPTGLSTASSSSFSSSSSKTKQHSRKGGSMEGLLNDNNNIILATKQRFGSARPLSVNLSANKIDNKSQHGQQNPPPVPPAPSARSHFRNTCDQLTHRTFSSHQKPPAPPPPPSSSTFVTRINQQSVDNETKDNKSSNVSTSHLIRGSNAISSNNSLNVTRPNVPPPNRPLISYSIDAEISKSSNIVDDNNVISQSGSIIPDNRSSYSLSSSDNLRTDFEEINADDIDVSVSVSPVVSLDSISAEDDDNDDSSFDNESHSLENLWPDCDIDHSKTTLKESYLDKESKKNTDTSPELPSISKNYYCAQSTSNHDTKHSADSEKTSNVGLLEKPPVKPARSISPKQSTPL